MVQKIFEKFIIVAFIALCGCHCTLGRPSSSSNTSLDLAVDPNEYNGDLSPETIRKVQQCDHDADAMELCMRCAKVTKSEIVYPLCCANEDNVKDWCKDYVFFAKENLDF